MANPYGLVVTPYTLPDAQELASLRPAFLCSILYRVDDLGVLLSTGLPLFIRLNNECQEVRADWAGWQNAVAAVASRGAGRIFALGAGNEFDRFWANNPADVPPAFAADLVRQAAPILRAHGIKAVATSLAGPNWQDYLAAMVALDPDEQIDWFDLHAYGQRPDGWGAPGWGFGDLRAALTRARQLAGRPVMMSEYGVKLDDAGGEDQVAAFMHAAAATLQQLGPDVCPRTAWFAWRDQIGTPDEQGAAAFGLRTWDGAARLAWDAFAALGETADPAPDPTPEPEPDPAPVSESDPGLPPTERAFAALWRAQVPSLAYTPSDAENVPAFQKAWRANIEAMGSPVSGEIDDEDGTKLMAFARGIWRWTGGDQIVRVA
jgi:hypothetical protein